MTDHNVRRVVFIVAHDAYLKGAQNLYTLIALSNKINVEWFTTSKRLVGKELPLVDVKNVIHPKIKQAHLVFAGLGGQELNHLISGLKDEPLENSPSIIGYFPGVLHLRIFDSLSTRLLCDHVFLNCDRDYQLYQRLARVTTKNENGILFGAPWIAPLSSTKKACDIDLLFIEQSIVPEALEERRLLVKRLEKLASENTHWEVVVALRTNKNNASSHQLKYCLEEISHASSNKPSNLRFVVGNIDILIARSHRVATISSSAAYTSLAWQKPTLFINDLGISKAFGNDLFEDSGYAGKLESIQDCKVNVNSWYQRFIKVPKSCFLDDLKTPYLFERKKEMIPGVKIYNLRLLKLIASFCFLHSINYLPEFYRLARTIRNINIRIYNSIE